MQQDRDPTPLAQAPAPRAAFCAARPRQALAALARRAGEAMAERPGPGTAPPSPLRHALRFFAGMLALTLIARGTAGAAMPVVTLQAPAGGTIVQQAALTGTVCREGGQAIALPEGLTVERLPIQVGQTVQEGDTLAQFSARDIRQRLRQKSAEQAQQQAELARCQQETPVDGSALQSAQTALTWAQEDAARTQDQQQRLVEQAQAQLNDAKDARQKAKDALKALQQADPAAEPEQLAAAEQQAESCKSAVTAAEQALTAAQQTQQDALLAADRAIETAQASLAQARQAYEAAQTEAALTAQSSRAQAELTALTLEQLGEEIALLEQLLQQEGCLLAPRSTTVLACDLAIGAQTQADQAALRLADDSSQTLAAFALPQKQAELLSPQQTVSVSRGGITLSATVQRVVYAQDGESSAQVTALLPQESTAAWAPGQPLQIQVTLSQTQYSLCLPAAAVRQDASGYYVLTVEQKKTALGITNTAVRVPVTVLEVSGDGAKAAVSGSLAGAVIVGSDRTVQPGSAVRFQA